MQLTIGISACLLGHKVRYDGRDKASAFCLDNLASVLNLQAFCPETAISLTIPRAPIQLVQQTQGIAVLPVAGHGEDLAPKLRSYAQQILVQTPDLAGFILMQKSPSCGVKSSKLFAEQQLIATDMAGAFVQGLQHICPYLPLIEEQDLADKQQLAAFLTAAFAYQAAKHLQDLQDQHANRAAWQALHSRFKYQLMASDPNSYKHLGRYLASPDFTSQAYIAQLIPALQKPISQGKHYNTLLHIAGYFKKPLSSTQRQAVHQQLLAFQQGHISLAQALSVLHNLQAQYPQAYLAEQFYLFMPEVIFKLYQ